METVTHPFSHPHTCTPTHTHIQTRLSVLLLHVAQVADSHVRFCYITGWGLMAADWWINVRGSGHKTHHFFKKPDSVISFFFSFFNTNCVFEHTCLIVPQGSKMWHMLTVCKATTLMLKLLFTRACEREITCKLESWVIIFTQSMKNNIH